MRRLPICEPDYTPLERLLMRVADARWTDYFSERTLYDGLPCLKPIGLEIIREAAHSLLKKGVVRLVFPDDPTDGRVSAIYCLSSRVTKAHVEEIWNLTGRKPTPYQLYQAQQGLYQ